MKKITFIGLIAVFISGAITLRAQEVITPLDVAKIQTVVEAIISTDGRYVAYTVTVPADPLKENKPSKRELYLYNVSTGKTLPYVTQGSVLSIAFRPGNFSSITFLSRREGDQGVSLYEISLSGGESKKIYSAETSISGYHWSADGKKLAYIASEKKKSTKTESSLPYQPEVYEENLSRSLALVYDTEKDVTDVIPLDGHTTEVAWSSDGSRLALLNAPSSLVDDKYMKQTIMIVQVSPFKWIGKVDHQGKMGKIAWSPDSKNIAFIAGEDIHDPEAGRLFIVGSEGGAPKNLKSDYAGSFDDFQWVDQKTLGFVSSVGVGAAYGTITGTGKAPVITFSASELALHGLSLASDGTAVFVADSPRHPREVYLLKKGEKSPARVTSHNTWLNDKKMARQEVIKYKAKDGLEIEGILIHPLNEQQGQRYPLITVVHGGPESHIDNGWLTGYSTPGQMAAAKGYAVFYPNYRGSTGRGAVFAKTSQGDLAGKEFDDIVDGVDYLVNSGLVDTKKVGVTGGSYGGYATGWMSTYYTERFAAGVMFVGVSNNISKWGTSDIPEELFLVHARKRVWDDYEWWLKRSPIYYADKAKTPLLIMHGKEDTRVYPGQSMELYRHIKTRTDTPVRLVFYPGEGHGNINATARFDYNLRLLRWFDKYLMDEEVNLDSTIEINK